MPSRPLKTELPRHKEAFEYYYNLGQDRSLEKVALEYDRCDKAVKTWSVSFHWQNRIHERDRELGIEIETKGYNHALETRERALRIVEKTITKYEKFIDGGDVGKGFQFFTSDLDKLLRLQSFLMGGADSRAETVSDPDLAGKSEDDLRTAILNEIKELQGLGAIPSTIGGGGPLEKIKSRAQSEAALEDRGGEPEEPSTEDAAPKMRFYHRASYIGKRGAK